MPLDINVPVFVSSTWLDLRPERRAVETAVQRLRETKFVGMEHFGSRDETTRAASLDDVDRSRVYVGIFAARYGSGITEQEYRRALSLNLPCLVYFKDDATVPDEFRETDPAQAAKLDALKQELRKNHIVGPDFKNPDDLAARVTADLHRWLFDNYLPTNLQAALRGEVSRDSAQALLEAVRDFGELSRDLLARLRGSGFNVSVGGDFVVGDKITNIYYAPPAHVPALHQLRAPVGDFVGRGREVAGVLAALRGGGGSAGISGMGGVGKTELALYIAGRLRGDYPDAQLVLDMRGTADPPRDPADALASCVRAFHGLEFKPPDGLDNLTRLYRSTLEGKRALILLDNAHDGAQVRPLLPPAGSALLVTSRNAVTLPGMKARVTLDQLEPAEARALLTGIAPRVTDETADEIARLCGYLPLAIRAAGSLLDVTTDLDPDAYVAQLRDERTRLELIGAEGVDANVKASFNLSYARLSPDARHVFRRLAVFPGSFDAEAEEFVCEDGDHRHLSDLLRRNLVLYNPDAARYRVHDLARIFAASLLGAAERYACRMKFAAHYLKVLREANRQYLRGGEALKTGLARFDLEWGNIRAGWSVAAEQPDGAHERALELRSDYPAGGVYLLALRQQTSDRILWLETGLAAARRLGNRAGEAHHLNNLGNAYTAPDQAVEAYSRALAINREIGNLKGQADALCGLGGERMGAGDIKGAAAFFNQALALYREVGDRRGEGTILGNLGTVHLCFRDYARAAELFEQELTIVRETGDRHGEAVLLFNLGTLYLSMREPRRAVEARRQGIEIMRELGDRRGHAEGLLQLAEAYRYLGDYESVLAHARASAELHEQMGSPDAEKARGLIERWRQEATKI